MKKTVKANIAENRYRFFTVVDELPEVGDIIERGQYEVLAINEVRLDPEQPNSDVFNYNYYEIVKRDLIDADAGEETITSDYVCIKWNDPIQKKFDEFAEKFGTVEWNGVELALVQKPYLFGPFDDWFFSAGAMDKDGNLWDVTWYPRLDAIKYDDYADKIADWNKPDRACIVDAGYYLD